MAVAAIGTAMTVERFRENAIETSRDGLDSAVRLLALHFDREFEDFSVLQKRHHRRGGEQWYRVSGRLSWRDGNAGYP